MGGLHSLPRILKTAQVVGISLFSAPLLIPDKDVENTLKKLHKYPYPWQYSVQPCWMQSYNNSVHGEMNFKNINCCFFKT